MHTACEVVAIQDIENTAQLAAAYILSIGGEEHV
jgi:putative aminopeptidase FrvX